jgi:GTP-binding protein
VFVASRNQNTLASFRYKKELRAERGEPGGKRRKHGRSAAGLVVQVPVGTQVLDAEGQLLFDFIADGQQEIVAHGGPGGFGNAHFVSSVRQAPRIAEKGELGEAMDVVLELKMIADVGLVGLPNAGKSTLLGSLSNAHPDIADYPFTTLTPNLGVVDIGDRTSLLFADIPGLIEGASQGKGLGDEFLRHVERTNVLIHLIDAYEDVVPAYKTIQKELKAYKADLTKLPQLVVLNKIDGMDKADVNQKLAQLKKALPKTTFLYAISAKSSEGVQPLLFEVAKLVQKQKTPKHKQITKPLPVIRLPKTNESWQVSKEKGYFVVSGKKIERFAERTDFTNTEGVQRLRDIIKKMGIERELIHQGIEPNTKVKINHQTFKW